VKRKYVEGLLDYTVLRFLRNSIYKTLQYEVSFKIELVFNVIKHLNGFIKNIDKLLKCGMKTFVLFLFREDLTVIFYYDLLVRSNS
jgi:hypothetical protein